MLYHKTPTGWVSHRYVILVWAGPVRKNVRGFRYWVGVQGVGLVPVGCAKFSANACWNLI